YVTPVFEGSQVVGYESVRVKPTAEQVRRAEPIYQRIHTGKSALPKRDKWLPILQDWLPFILVSQLSFMIGAWLNSHWGFALAAALSVPLGLLGLIWQQRGLKRLLWLAEQTTSDPTIAQMYTHSRRVQAPPDTSILSEEPRVQT
ncbi:chemotaxis protein, partial [Pseudomonas sp. MWU12-2534b]